jgi:hypothetical protein
LREIKKISKKLWKQNRVIEALLTFCFEQSSKYVGVTKQNETSKNPWQAKVRINGKLQHLGCFKTEIEAAKCVNCVCKKHNCMELKNPELSDEEENFTWCLPAKNVAIFLYVFFLVLIVCVLFFSSSIDKFLLRED